MEEESERVFQLVEENATSQPGRERLEAEYGRIEAVLDWCLEHDARRGLEISARLGAFWSATGRFEIGRRWLSALVAATATGAQDAIRSRALSTASNLAFRQGDNEEARRLASEALAIARRLDNPERLVDALTGLARVGLRDEDPERVRQLSEDGRAVARNAGKPELEKLPLHCLAEATRMAGDYDGARRLYEESIVLNRRLNDARMLAVETSNLAAVELHEGDLNRATSLWEDSLRCAFSTGDLYLLPYAVMGLGEVATAAQQYERAVTLLAAASGIFESTGQQIDPADRAVYEGSVSRARDALGREAFETLWNQGADLRVDRAVEAALAVPPQP